MRKIEKEAAVAVKEAAGRMILNEILNSDYRDLQERIDRNPDATSSIGMCGESPAHIAIYKNDPHMLKMLLDAGTSPNLPNSAGNSLTHAAAQLGNIYCLKILYETHKCSLTNKNRLNQTALDISKSSVQESDLLVTKLFALYVAEAADEVETWNRIIEGRKECAAYLIEKMTFDRNQKVNSMVYDTLDDMKERRRKARIVRGVGGANYSSFYADINYNKHIQQPPWEPIDLEFFAQYTEGLNIVLITTFACDYVNKSIRAGFQNAVTRLQLPQIPSRFPVPPVEGRLQAPIPLFSSLPSLEEQKAQKRQRESQHYLSKQAGFHQQQQVSFLPIVAAAAPVGSPIVAGSAATATPLSLLQPSRRSLL
mmetsp:Transcript_19711/g.32944  ORF Transcript_19711/g.32944 Transcript_19711/m.32944 type:complete len:367 (+) Transcript_19711:42-1142(+)